MIKKTKANLTQRLVTAILLAASFISCYLFFPAWVLSVAFAAIGTIIMTQEWSKIGIPLLSPIYPILPLILLIILNQSEQYRHLIIFTIALAAAFDTGAYAIGTLFGKHKITRISPGKSWQGLAGGLISTTIATYMLFTYYEIRITTLFFILFVLIISAAAFFGDLFVSWLKRRAHVKDSGRSLPGHGGLLDRFDSTLFIVVLIFALKSYLLMP